MQDKRKLPRVIGSLKSKKKLWLKFQLNRSIFLFSSLKSVTVNFYFLNLILDIRIRNPDLDSEYKYGSRIQAQIEFGSNQIRIRITVANVKLFFTHIPYSEWPKRSGSLSRKTLDWIFFVPAIFHTFTRNTTLLPIIFI